MYVMTVQVSVRAVVKAALWKFHREWLTVIDGSRGVIGPTL
jgi:hypothetical protein